MSKTGSPAIPDSKQLLREDIMALDYAGDEAVTGNLSIYVNHILRIIDIVNNVK